MPTCLGSDRRGWVEEGGGAVLTQRRGCTMDYWHFVTSLFMTRQSCSPNVPHVFFFFLFEALVYTSLGYRNKHLQENAVLNLVSSLL